MELSFEIVGQIEPVALYAAIVATAVLVWDIIKWRRSGARLKGIAGSNMVTFGMGPMDNQRHVVISVDNIGDRPTTVSGVYLQGYANRWRRFRRRPDKSAVINSGLQANYPIPHRLDVGANFKASVQQTPELEEWSRAHRLYAEVAHSAGRPLWLRIKPIERGEAGEPSDE